MIKRNGVSRGVGPGYFAKDFHLFVLLVVAVFDRLHGAFGPEGIFPQSACVFADSSLRLFLEQ